VQAPLRIGELNPVTGGKLAGHVLEPICRSVSNVALRAEVLASTQDEAVARPRHGPSRRLPSHLD
jgi:hypothetical protein